MRFSFFFCKQKTAYEMRISDWSSDVGSSDLIREKLSRALSRQSAWFLFGLAFIVVYREVFETILFYAALWTQGNGGVMVAGAGSADGWRRLRQIGRASCRERVCQYV